MLFIYYGAFYLNLLTEIENHENHYSKGLSLDTQRESWSKLASLFDLCTLYNIITYESNII